MSFRLFIEGIFSPGSILFPPYLASALTIALLWLVIAEKYNFRQAWAFLFSRSQWLSRSARIDFILCLINLLILRSVVSGTEKSSFKFALNVVGGALEASSLPTIIAGPGLEMVGATLVTMLSIDAASYFVHRWMHKLRALWAIHSVHHAAERLTPLTTYRQHPLEPILLYGARGLAAGIGLATFHRLFPAEQPVATLYGLGAGFFIYMFTVNLHHLEIPVHYPRCLRWILISPHHHHIHHSSDPQHYDRNFGVVFSIWDRLFGTYYDKEIGLNELSFGLGSGDPFRHSISASLLQPLQSLFKPVLPAAAATGALLFGCGRFLILTLPLTALALTRRLLILFGFAFHFHFRAVFHADFFRARREAERRNQ